jgi:hypothetical protein
MIKSEVDDCSDLIKKIKTNKLDNSTLRNELYFIMKKYILIWIKSVLKDKNFYSKEELTSLSWDCFLFCLKYYNFKQNIPLPNHFHSYTKYFLLTTFKKNKLESCHEYFKEGLTYEPSVFEHLDDLKKFKESLPNEYKCVFDDALMSMSDSNKNKMKRHDSTKLTHTQYNESKKIMKMTIHYLLRR